MQQDIQLVHQIIGMLDLYCSIMGDSLLGGLFKIVGMRTNQYRRADGTGFDQVLSPEWQQAAANKGNVRGGKVGGMKKILVTGGAGFIGSAVIRQFINETDCSVVNLDKLTYAGNLQSLASIADNPRYRFEKVDICDAGQLTRVFREHQPDAVMHLAAESHVDRSISGPADFIQTNIVGTCIAASLAAACCHSGDKT